MFSVNKPELNGKQITDLTCSLIFYNKVKNMQNSMDDSEIPPSRILSGILANPVRIAVITLAFLILTSGFSPVSAKENNWEFYTSTAASVKMTNDLKFQIQRGFRFRDGEPVFNSTNVSFTQNLNKSISTGFSCNQSPTIPGKDWRTSGRIFLTGTAKHKMNRLNIENRHRLDYRLVEGGRNSFTYRTRLKLSYPVESKIKLQPYISNEVFINFKSGQNSKFDGNRLTVGVSAEPIKNFSFDLYYVNHDSLLRRKKGEEWQDKNILGLSITYKF
jgi:hypothetical protein